MTRHAWQRAAGVCLLGVALWIVAAPPGRAGEEENKYKAPVLKIAEAIKKGNKDDAVKQAAAIGKKLEDLDDVMELFKKRDEGGLGVGQKPGAITPDGIDLKVLELSKGAPSAATLKKDGEALENMAYVIAAIAEITIAKGPPKKFSKAKDWGEWSVAMRANAAKLADAAKAKNGPELTKVAAKLVDQCNACHSKYRVKPGGG